MNCMRAIIAIALVIGLSITVATVVVGTRTFEGTVVKDAYTEGLRWDEIRRARQESGWSARLVREQLPLGRSTFQVWLLDRANDPLQDVKVTFSFTKPETSRFDRIFQSRIGGSGIYEADIDLPRPGRWQVKITIVRGDRVIVYDEQVFVTK